VVLIENTRLYLLVFRLNDRNLPEPKALSWVTPRPRVIFSAEEKPAVNCIAPVGFSSTVSNRSTWSGAPGTSWVSMATLLK